MKNLILSLILFLSFSGSAIAAPAKMTWTAPTEREDNTKLKPSEIKQYKVYYGTEPGMYDYTVDVPATGAVPEKAEFTLPTGFTYYFVVTTVDTDGRESLYSQMVKIPLEHER